MKISKIENVVDVVRKQIVSDCEFSHVHFDSRKIRENGVFVAVPGTHVDGHDYINVAIENGASLIICERFPEQLNKNVNYLQVKSSSKALGFLASEFCGNPSSKLKLVGVTGTNGKTTIATLLYNLFENLGYKTGLLSTVKNYVHRNEIVSTHTTPDPVQINELMGLMVDAGCDYCFMEVSSHAIDQNRIAGLDFNGGVFTNLTHDHLDYHKDFQSYLNAKKSFFDNLSDSAFALTNIDDKNGAVMLQSTKAHKKTFSLQHMSDFRLRVEEKHFEGMQLFIDGVEVWTSLLGMYNASNLLAVYSVAVLLGLQKEEILVRISELKSVEGRMETIRSADGKTAIVDYAHTPDALENVLSTLSEFRLPGKSIISVVGAGGDRDHAKRANMGKIAALWSDKVVFTSDNPRSEDPEKILDDILKGVPQDRYVNTLRVTNRKEAIKVAWALAGKGDLVLIAGKGHETYQEIKGVKHHFDDREVVRELLNQ